jgi:hypothetical protein
MILQYVFVVLIMLIYAGMLPIRTRIAKEVWCTKAMTIALE